MKLLNSVRPEYLHRPRQVLVRIRRALQRRQGNSAEVTLPWGATLRVNPHEYIGSIIWHRGIFDLMVLEALSRLIEPGETALDIGANIGQMASLMSFKVGTNGRLMVFEPHPELFAELSDNLARLRGNPRCGQISLHPVALSNAEGRAVLEVRSDWDNNRGLARLAPAQGGLAAGQVEVRTTTLDRTFEPGTRIGVCKLDVEGHELKVLEGAEVLLAERRIRDIIFEDLDEYPTPVHDHLLERGFALFSLHSHLRRPLLRPVLGQPEFNQDIEGANFLATLDPDRARARFKSAGWQALK
jgi:FkbM family methyltransferase